MDPSLLQLPAAIQLALASGYAAYLVAYRGIREHHKTIDTAFLALVFSVVATGISLSIKAASWRWVMFLTFGGTVSIGVLWRLVGIDLIAWINRSSDLSWSDDTPSAWAGLMQNSRYRITQVGVLTDDDTWLRCDYAERFEHSPFGAVTLGTNGDIAMYLTHVQEKGCSTVDARELSTVLDDDYGDRLTYIPSGKVKRVTIRHKRLIVTGWRTRLSNLARRFGGLWRNRCADS